MEAVRIVPVGEGISRTMLDELAGGLGRLPGFSCRVESERLDPICAYQPERNQYWSTAILRQLLERYADAPRILGVTSLDLFVPVLTFVFGEGQIGGRAALISTCRLQNEFYGLPPDSDLARQRVVKEAAHELGHTAGLRHCSDWRCIMSSSHGIETLDLKESNFCPACAALVIR